MAQYKTNSMGFPLTFNGPDSVEDYDRISGKTGSCLEDACDNTIYRSTLPDFQGAFAKRLEKLTGVTRAVNTEQTQKNQTRATAIATAKGKEAAKVADVLETVSKYVKRATVGMSETDLAALETMAQEVAAGITVDPSPSKRQAGIPKDLLAKADSVLNLDEDAREAKLTKWLDMVDGFEIEREDDNTPTRNSVAKLAGEVLKTL